MSLLDLFRPAWEKSNPEVRLQSVRNFDPTHQSQLLVVIAKKDRDARVRKAAIQQINDLDALHALEEKEDDSELRRLLKQKIDVAALQLLKQTPNPAMIDRWFSRLRDNSALETLLHDAALPELRMLCVEKVTRSQPLAHTARQDGDEAVARAAVEKIDQPKFLQEIARSARHTSIRELAEKKLEIQNELQHRERESALRLLRIDALLASMRRFAEEQHILSLEEEAIELMESWKVLSDIASKEQSAEFHSLQAVIEEKLEIARKAREQEEAEEKKRAKEQSHLETLLFEVKEMLSLPESRTEAIDRFQELRQRWGESAQHLSQSAIALLEPEFNALVTRVNQIVSAEASVFQQAKTAIEQKLHDETNQVKEASRQKMQEAQSAFHAKLDQLEELIEKVRQLNPEEEFDAAVEKLREYQRQWGEIVGEEREKFGKAWKRFRQATSSFSQLEEWERWHNQREREKLIAEAESLVEESSEAAILKEVKRLRDGWRKSGSVAREQYEDLKNKFNTAIESALSRCQAYLEEQEQERIQNLDLKRALIVEFKELVEAHPEPNTETTQAAKILQEKWRTVGPVPREENDLLWEEYRALSDLFFSQRRVQMKAEKQQRQVNLEKKTELCEEAEALSDSEAWSETTTQFKELQRSWKEIGPVPRQHSDEIWKRFRTACDLFFDKKKAHFNLQDNDRQKNLDAKIALCEAAEQLDRSAEVDQLEAEIKRLLEEWGNIGHVPPKEIDAITSRFDSTIDALQDELAQRSPDYKATQDNIIKTKRVIVDQAKALAFSNDWKGTTEQLKTLQQEWRVIGRAGSREEPLWIEFRKACDDFFERRRDQFDILEQSRNNNLDQKMVLVEHAERIAGRVHDEEAKREIRMLRKQWREIGQVPRRHSDKIWDRFNAACDLVFADHQSEPGNTEEESDDQSRS